MSDAADTDTGPAPAPATLVAPLFPSEVVSEESAPSEADVLALLPDEAALVASAIAKRRREFASGRITARRALGRLGITGWPLLARERAPVWPPDVVGSISHTSEYVAAVVARAGRIRALGLDVEEARDLEPRLWASVLTEGERAWLEGAVGTKERCLAAKLLFVAKECAYKCQHPIEGRWLDFHDVTVRPDLAGRTLAGRGDRVGGLAVQVHGEGEGLGYSDRGLVLRARYRMASDLVLVGMTLETT